MKKTLPDDEKSRQYLKMIQQCLSDYQRYLETIVFPGELNDYKLDIIKNILKNDSRLIKLAVKHHSDKKLLLKDDINWTGIYVVTLTFFISIPLLIFKSWYFLGSINLFQSDGKRFLNRIQYYINIYEAYQKERPELVNNTPKPLENTHSTIEPFIDQSALNGTAIVPYQPIQFVPNKDTSGSIPSQTKMNNFMYLLNVPTFLGPFNFTDDMFTKNHEVLNKDKLIITNTRIHPFNYKNGDDIIIDFNCNFLYFDQTPITTTIKIMTNLNSFFEDAAKSEPTAEPKTSTWNTLCPFFSLERTFQDIFNEAKNAAQHHVSQKLYKQAFNIASSKKERVIAIAALINDLDSEYKFHQINSSTKKRCYGAVRMGQIKYEISLWIQKLPHGFQSVSPEIEGLKIELSQIFQHIQENQIGEAAFLYLRLKNYTAFVKRTCPNLIALLNQLDAIFYLIEIPQYGRTKWYDTPPTDKDLQKNPVYIYCKNDAAWCAFVTPGGTTNHIELDNDELEPYAEHMLYYLENYGIDCPRGEYRYVLYNRLDEIICNTIKPRDYYQYNKDGLCLYKAYDRLKHAYKIIQTYDSELAETFYQKSFAPMTFLEDSWWSRRIIYSSSEHTANNMTI